jgi:hypothetical protein
MSPTGGHLGFSIGPKSNNTWLAEFGWDGPWVVLFQYCVRQHCPPFIMAAVTKNRNFFSSQFLLYYKSK